MPQQGDDDDRARAGQPVGKVENETEGGRYGAAPPGKPHLAPEVEPARGNDPPVNLPAAIPGALPENGGRRLAEPSEERRSQASGRNPDVPRREGEREYEEGEPLGPG